MSIEKKRVTFIDWVVSTQDNKWNYYLLSQNPNITIRDVIQNRDKNWNYTQKKGTATYTNVPKGNYIFKVKSTNSQGIWVENQRQLPITIKPSIFNSNWSYLVYVLVLIGLFLLINHIIITIFRLKYILT